MLYEIEREVHYDLYFLMDIDVPWIADPLRDLGNRRTEMMRIFKSELGKERFRMYWYREITNNGKNWLQQQSISCFEHFRESLRLPSMRFVFWPELPGSIGFLYCFAIHFNGSFSCRIMINDRPWIIKAFQFWHPFAYIF